MDDLNWLCEHAYAYLEGMSAAAALEALEALGLRDGDVLAGHGAANVSQVSIVLRKAQEARASGANKCVVWCGVVSSGGGRGVRGAHTHRCDCPTILQARVVCFGTQSCSIHQSRGGRDSGVQCQADQRSNSSKQAAAHAHILTQGLPACHCAADCRQTPC